MSAESTPSFAARVAAGMVAGQALILLTVTLLYRADRGDGRFALGSVLVGVRDWSAHKESALSGEIADRVYSVGAEEQAARVELLRCAGSSTPAWSRPSCGC